MDQHSLRDDLQAVLNRLDRLEDQVAGTSQRTPAAQGQTAAPRSNHPPRFAGLVPQRTVVSLRHDCVEEFLKWVAAVPVSNPEWIREQIAAVAHDHEIVDALAKQLHELPVRDFGRHLLLLSVLGEMRNPRALEPLKQFIHLPSDSVIQRPPAETGTGLRTSHLEYGAALQARAVEMLAYMRNEEALAAVLDTASRHESAAVRIAALDAYAFNHDDHPDAMERLHKAARPIDAKHVGLPRRSRNGDPAEFDARVHAFYERHPGERPPVPKQVGGLPRPKRQHNSDSSRKD